ncbi:enoyl-CoA hydratase/isomerase family protein [Sphingobium sp. EP60837]|uniref:enoyl-CoA hydratase/isomerase family protein n=1 Tax=Sphingobium sp. EP60837 TaxID=1855519 RepID=UPI0007DCF077|nr:enoyl-CoA hydratase-related protein [Sphingobium sp. EP60837]ANI80158.1 3-hydroxyacyl-CoA dehydrogenase [Sphingobium sp. EP60837]
MSSGNKSDVVRLEKRDDIGIITIDNPPINAGARGVRIGLLAAVQAFSEDSGLAAGVLIGAGRMFMAGSDMREINAPVLDPILPEVIGAIERCPKPIVAAIAGAALGGGYELSLGCDARIASPEAVVGLPECALGMMPGAGGTQRLPRLAGLPVSIRLICSGERVKARRAAEIGMIDKVVDGPLLEEAIAFARGLGGRKRRVMEMTAPDCDPADLDRAKVDALAAGGGRPHIQLAIDAVEWCRTRPGDEALREERKIFDRLRTGPEAEAMLHLFFAERDSMKDASVDLSSSASLDHVAIVGIGPDCDALAAAMVRRGHSVVLVSELSDLDAVSSCDVIFVAEQANDDRIGALLVRLSAHARAHAVVLVAGGGQTVATLEKAFGRSGKLCGWRGMAGAAGSGIVEIVRQARTEPRTLATALALAKAAGQMAVMVGDSEGLVGRRIAAAAHRSCVLLQEQGVRAEQLREVLTRFGLPVPPLSEATRAEPQTTMDDEQIASWILVAIANEAALMLAAGRVRSPGDVDLLLTNAYGFPRHEGGIGLWARRQQRANLKQVVGMLAEASGERFERAPDVALDALCGEG